MEAAWSPEFKLKVVLLGNKLVGKTCLANRFANDTYNPCQKMTIGVAYSFRRVKVKGKMFNMHIWDTAGDERFRSLTQVYYRGARAALVCFDLTSRQSWEDLPYWIEELKKREENCNIYLVGTKCDLLQGATAVEPVATVDDIREYIAHATENKARIKQYYEISSRTGTGIDKLFQDVTKYFIEDEESPNQGGSIVALHDENVETDEKCSC